MDDVHRLEGSTPQQGGLIIRKNEKDDKKDVFKVPMSKFGLDKLAIKLRAERESGLLSSFKDHDDDEESTKFQVKKEENEEIKFKKSEPKVSKDKHYRASNSDPETPSHSSPAIRDSVRQHYHERITEKQKGLYTSSKDKDKNRRKDDRKSHKSSSSREYDRKRSRDDDSSRSSRRKDRSDRYRDPETPRYYESGSRSSVGRSSWDEEDDYKSKKKRSSWDFPTPNRYKSRSDDSVRSSRSDKSHRKYEDDTPRPTPAHKFNQWAADRKRTEATPQIGDDKNPKPWQSDEDRDLWEEEQIRLDREWYVPLCSDLQ